jgi:hypothetical protein
VEVAVLTAEVGAALVVVVAEAALTPAVAAEVAVTARRHPPAAPATVATAVKEQGSDDFFP